MTVVDTEGAGDSLAAALVAALNCTRVVADPSTPDELAAARR